MAGLYPKLYAVIVAFGSLSGVLLNFALSCNCSLWIRAIMVILSCVFLALTLLFGWILIQRPSPRQSLTTTSIHFLLTTLQRRYGKYLHAEVMATCDDPMQHQKRLWQDILDTNGQTAYAKDHNLQSMTTLDELRNKHPLTGYERFRPYVERMTEEGEKDVLVKGSPDSYIRTTGTTGKSKYIPQKNKTWMLLKVGVMITHVSLDNYPSNTVLKSLYLYVAPKVIQTNSGCDIETAATMPEGKDWIFAQFCAPAAGYRIGSMNDAFYVQLLFALMDENLGTIVVGFVHFLESGMKLLEKEWPNFVKDIENGTLKSDLNLAPDIRASVTDELHTYGGDPARAAQLRKEFEKGFVGIIRRIWPRVPAVFGIDSTGSWPRLSTTYTKGLSLFTGFYGCSECPLGVAPGYRYMEKGYIPLAKWAVMEFIKEEDMSSSQPKTFFFDEVEKGQNYEIVITQPFGLYRYRMGDVVQVIDFYKQMPVIDFLYRTGQMLNIRYEKLDQCVVSDSVRAATGQWKGRTLMEFAVAESTILNDKCSIYEPKELMPYYIFFLEMKEEGKPISDDEKSLIDKELRSRNSDVERLRSEGAISRPRVHLVRPGAFGKLEQYLYANTGATPNQYKVPRKLRTLAMAEVMIENIAH